MTASFTLTRGGSSVTVELLETDGPLVSRTTGKPQLNLHNPSGQTEPLSRDHMSAVDGFNLVGRLQGASAFSDADTLASIVKERYGANSNALQLSFTNVASLTATYKVAPLDASALTLTYPGGTTDHVEVEFNATQVSETRGF